MAARRPWHPFLVFGDAEVTYAEASERIGRVAGGLARLGYLVAGWGAGGLKG